ncbi:MAG: hypothetical protein M1827_002532 [Pycnora praestabilis]|nr:MAG: hypothetical protein M1827_002532 [Pycnora praestabilis]
MSPIRGISPLTFEPLSPSPSEILVSDSDDDDRDHRASKRRRIESLGQQYLAGRPLLIHSASLKGPFDKSWRNPWQKRRYTGTSKVSDPIFRREREIQHGKVEIYPLNRYEDYEVSRRRLEGVRYVARKERSTGNEVTVRKVSAVTHKPQGMELGGRKTKGEAKHVEQHQEGRATAVHAERRPHNSGHAVGLRDVHGNSPDKAGSRTANMHQNDWLKSDQLPTDSSLRQRSLSTTPTPAAMESDRRQYHGLPAVQSPLSGPIVDPIHRQMNSGASSPTPSTMKAIKFAAANERDPLIRGHIALAQSSANFNHLPHWTATMTFGNTLPNGVRVGETSLVEAEPDVVKGLVAAKGLSSQAASQASNSESPNPPHGPVELELSRIAQQELQVIIHVDPDLPADESVAVVGMLHREQNGQSDFTGSKTFIHALPPSTSLPAFEYRRANPSLRQPGSKNEHKDPTESEGETKKPRSTDFAMQAVNQSSMAKCPLGFVADEVIAAPIFDGKEPTTSISNSYDDLASTKERMNQVLDVDPAISPEKAKRPLGDRLGGDPQPSTSLAQRDESNGHSGGSSLLQAAQVLSTKISRTDGDPSEPLSTDDGILNPNGVLSAAELSNATLSTQVALAEAQRSFQADIIAPMKRSSLPSLLTKHSQISVADAGGIAEKGHSKIDTPVRSLKAPNAVAAITPMVNDEPMSTQDMLDAVSPYRFSTLKKPISKKRAIFAPPPMEKRLVGDLEDMGGFGKLGLDTETSPETSKPQSPHGEKRAQQSPVKKRTSKAERAPFGSPLGSSFSITPNGILKTVYSQDGQGRNDDIDLNAMIDDVGGFLESWDVESELRKTAASTMKPTTSVGSISNAGVLSGRWTDSSSSKAV